MKPAPGGQVVAAVPGGPLLVRGARGVTDEDGNEVEVSRPVVAICRCGLSQREPWCDATHRAVRPTSAGAGAGGEDESRCP